MTNDEWRVMSAGGVVPAVLALVLGLVSVGAGLEESFSDTAFPPAGWTRVNADSGIRNWQRLDIGTRTPPGCAYCGWESYYLRNNDWLITPQCSVAAGDRFSFWFRAQDEAFYESLEVLISAASPRLEDFLPVAAFGTGNIGYTEFSYDLSGFTGQKVFLALVYRSHNKYGMMIDDVTGPQTWFPAHDVGVSRVKAPPPCLRVGARFRPACRVFNQGQAGEWVRVSFEIPGVWRADTGLALAPAESAEVSFPEMAVWQPDTYEIVFATHLGLDQRRWNDTCRQEFVVAPFLSRGGPDSLGYVWFDSDDPQGPEFNWQELAGSGTFLGAGDDTVYWITLDWSLPLYGRDYSMAFVSTNGWLALGPPVVQNPADSNHAIPSQYGPKRLIAPFWDNLDLRSGEGGIWYHYFGDSVMVVEWHQARRKGCGQCSLRFEAKLFRSGAIELHYANVDAGDRRHDQGMSATVGIENAAGSVGLQYLYNGAPAGNLLVPGRAIRFFPSPPGMAEEKAALTRGWTLKAEPNPAFVSTVVSYEVPVAANVRLSLFDAAGRQNAVLRTGPHSPGRYSISVLTQQMPGGIYFLRLEAAGRTQQVKLVCR